MRFWPTINTFFVVILIITTAHGIIVKQENSLYGPYEAGAPNIYYWDLTGAANLGQTFIRLTPDEPEKQGGIWNNYPVSSNDWELHMQFHIHGKGVSHNGNGMAIWYVRDIMHPGPVFGSRDYFSGLGIFIDTTEDPLRPHKHKHPYLSAVVNNGTQAYEHNEDGTVHQVGGCHMPVRNLEWPTKIAVSYIGNVLTIFLDVEGREQWTQCFRSEGVYLPTHYFFGITASTGEAYSDNHDIIYITSLDMNLPDKQPQDKSYIVPSAENILIHPKPDEIQKTVEKLQQFEEELQKVEEKREVKEEPKMQIGIPKPKPPKETEKQKPLAWEKPKPKEAEKSKPKAEGTGSSPVSFMTKAIYVTGIVVIIFVAYSLFRKYSAQRHERMQKRLF